LIRNIGKRINGKEERLLGGELNEREKIIRKTYL